MIGRIFFFSVVLFGCAHHEGEVMGRYGIDYWGGAKYPELIREHHPNGWSAAFLSYNPGFGDGLIAAKGLIESGRKVPIIEFALSWKDDHKYDSHYIEILLEASRVAHFTELYPKQRFEVAAGLENTSKNPDEILFMMRDLFKENTTLINIPWLGGGGKLSSRFKNELHNETGATSPFNFSFDGKDPLTLDYHAVIEANKDADVIFFWHPWLNGKKDVNDNTPRERRPVLATKELILQIKNMAP